MDNEIPEKTKRRALKVFWNQKSSKFLKETVECAYTTANVKKLSKILFSVKFYLIYFCLRPEIIGINI